MTISRTANLVLIPTPGMGHLVPAVELANHLVARDSRLSVTVLLINLPVPDDNLDSYIHSLKSNPSLLKNGVGLIDVPLLDPMPFDPASARPGFLTLYMEAYQSKVKDAVKGLHAAGLLLDMFCTAMVDVAADLGLPSYVFFPSGASLLRMMFHLQGLGVDDVAQEYDVVRSPDTTVAIPGFRNSVPVKVWPGSVLNKDGGSVNFLRHAEKYRLAKGILVNTFSELERDLIDSMTSQGSRIPPIYPVGPILHLAAADDDHHEASKDPILSWLDAQPPQSVVFLCFGSRGSFDDTQVKEIAAGLERSGLRFLWSLRRRPNNHCGLAPPSEFDDVSSVLPEGFLERTGERGRVIGWAPQARVLGHVAVGAFVSHCGWNSTLESLWYGVPIAAWPVYAEQQLNAFVLVRELGLATEVRMDYRQDFGVKMVVGAAEVEEGIRKAAAEATEVRKKVEEMSETARKAVEEGGSSYESLGRFIDGVFQNLP